MQVGDLYNPKGLFTGIYIPESMVRLPNTVLSPGAKLLFGRLSWHVNNDGDCFPSRDTLAEEIGVSESSIRDYLRELEENRFIIRVRSGPKTNSYDFPWHSVLEASLKKKHRQPSADQEKSLMDTPPRNDRQPSVFPIITEVREGLREVSTPPTPSSDQNYTHRDLINQLNSEGGLLGKGQRAAINALDLTELAFEQALAKARIQAERPLRPSRKTTGPTRPVRQTAPRVYSQPVEETALGRDYPGEWNRIVLAAQVTWDPSRSVTGSLRSCAADAVFRDRFTEICTLAQKCHESRPDSTWLTFEWLLRDKGEGFGWWRLLNDLRWMSKPPAQEKKSNVFDEIKRRREAGTL